MITRSLTRRTGVVSRYRGATAVGAAVIAAAAGYAVPLPRHVAATAIVAVDEPSAALRAAAARGGAGLAASTPVVARAASSLIGTDMPVPEPTWLDRFGVATGVLRARGATVRMSDALAGAVSAQPGDGYVEIRAEAADANAARRYASAMAEALVAEEELAASSALHRRENVAADRLETLRTAVRTARERLAALGGTDVDPAEASLAAAAATRDAEARLAAVRAVIAAGSPPLGAGSDLPASIAALQGTYWDLRKQFDKASETLGDRHTTVIALRDGVARAATTLTTEWQKIERSAAGAVEVTRSREAVLRKTAVAPDGARQAAIDEARRTFRRASAAMAAPGPMVPLAAVPFRVLSVAVPVQAAEGPSSTHAMLAGGAGALALGLMLLPFPRRKPRARLEQAEEPVATDVRRTESPKPISQVESEAPSPGLDAATIVRDRAQYLTVAPPQISPVEADAMSTEAHLTLETMISEASGADPGPAVSSVVPPAHASLSATLRDGLRGLVASLDGTPAALPGLPCVMVAANSAGIETGATALALGELAAELGYRVLVIEAGRSRPTLAASVAPDGEPLLVDVHGSLRVALPSETTAGLLLAPALRGGARLAAALVRNTQALIVEDLAGAFDLLVVDGGCAAEALASGWSADRYLRVGTAPSPGDDDRFLATIGAASTSLLGTVADGRFVAYEPVTARRVANGETRPAEVRSPVRSTISGAVRRRAAPQNPPARSAPRRRVVAR